MIKNAIKLWEMTKLFLIDLTAGKLVILSLCLITFQCNYLLLLGHICCHSRGWRPWI